MLPWRGTLVALAALEFRRAEEQAGGEGCLAVDAGEVGVGMEASGQSEGVAAPVFDGYLFEAGFLLVGVGTDLGENGLAGFVAYVDL